MGCTLHAIPGVRHISWLDGCGYEGIKQLVLSTKGNYYINLCSFCIMGVIIPLNLLSVYVPSKGHTDKLPGFRAEGIGRRLKSWRSTCVGCAEIDKSKSLSESLSDKMTRVKVFVKVVFIYLVMLLVGELGGANLAVLVSSLNIKKRVIQNYMHC